MKTMTLTAILWAAIASGVAAQFSATIGVTGTTLAGTTFTLRLQASPTYTRDIDFSGLTTDHSALAMASLMTAKINTDYRKNENTGFQAENPMKADGKSKFDATFELHCTVPITDVLVGALGNPTTGIPRPPGVAQNPNIFNFQSSHGLFPFQGAQVGQTNANMTVDAIDPALDFRRRIEHVIGEPFTLQISSGPNGNAGFFLLAGPLFHGALMLPITGDFIDLGIPTGPASAPLGISVLGDGISSLTGSLWDSLFRTDGAGAFTLSLGNTGGLGRFNVG
ncbi:MAG: hypothetical protein KDB53_20445, partial [Planctomycetes bacterium]|nr:hypothetical protein [Planctomycetota bacterium]